VAGGLLREARWLMSLGVTAGSCNAARAIGYRQALEFMQVGCPGSQQSGLHERGTARTGAFGTTVCI
jgi:tRNA A37 N6-isopentenylltransferase MiaA